MSAQAEVYTYQGLTTCTNLEDSWTIMSGTWNHLNKRWNGLQASLPHYIREERLYQEGIEAEGYRSPTWRVLRALQELHGAKTLQGESALTAPPFFEAAGRGQRIFWGSPPHEATVYLWEGLDEDGKRECERITQQREDWVIWARTRRKTTDRRDRFFEQKAKALFRGGVRVAVSYTHLTLPTKA